MDLEKKKEIIDGMNYTELLRKWRFSTSGDPLFIGDAGNYYQEVMKKKKDEIGCGAAAIVSKIIGWGD